MNAIAVVLNQFSQLQAGNQFKHHQSTENRSVFDAILEKVANPMPFSQQEAQPIVTPEHLTELLNLLQSEGEGIDDLDLEQLTQLVHELGMEPLDEEIFEQLKLWLEEGSFMEGDDVLITTHPLPLNVVTMQASGQVLTDAQVIDQLSHLFNEVRGLLGQGTNEQQLSQIAPKILELLEKWTKLETTSQHVMEQAQGLLESNPREGQLWRELLLTFQKRHQFASNQQYHSNAEVTTRDVVNWLTRTLSADVQVEHPTTIKSVEHISGMPMSRVEQYVIHIQQGQGAQPADKQLMDQFQNMIKSNRFLTTNHGVKQFSITLRPENLGEMMVRLTETNGEMMVKILVSSQATRQMLEANIHQLKNMFAPHQVVIEESNELHVHNTAEEQEQQEQPFDDHDNQESSQQSRQEKSKESDVSFHDVLMNEKV